MLRQIQIQIQKINNKIKSNNYYFYFFLILVSFNYIILYNYLLDKNYNIILFYFIYFFLLYTIFDYFSYIIIFITFNILNLLNIDNYIKNSTIIENHTPATVQNYRAQRRMEHRQQQRQQRQNRPRNAIYQGVDEEDSLESRVQRSADERGRAAEEEAQAVQADGPPDPAYLYITAHLPDCGKEMISIKSLPLDPKYTQALP
jgi:hypothetical protein